MPSNGLHVTPAVIFVDDGPWECFFQLAAVIRKARVRTVRITVGSKKSRAECIQFDRNVSLPFPPSAEELAGILSSEFVIDVQPSDSLAALTYAALKLVPPAQLVSDWNDRTSLLDKLSVTKTLRDRSLCTPDNFLVKAFSPAEAVARLSLPMVVKRRVGSAGTGVKVFESLELLEEFVMNLQNPDDWFYERFIHGRSIVCASYAGDDGIEVITTYEILKRFDPFGPSVVVEIQDDAKLRESGRILVNALHIRGFLCFDIIRDSNDVDWIHDINVRVFGTFALCQLAGFDFIGAYIGDLVGGTEVRTPDLGLPATRAYLFPNGHRDVFTSGRFGVAPVRTLKWIWSFERLLGLQYLLCLVLRAFISSLQRNRQRLSFRFSSSSRRR